MQCVILAGGLATRLGPLTERQPKALLEAHGRAFCDYQIDLLEQNGVENVIFCIGHLGEMIRERVRGRSLAIRFVDEGRELMGTGGALRKALDEGVLHERFMMIYGDSYLPVDYRAVYAEAVGRRAPVLLTVMRNEGRWDKSNCRVEGGFVRHYSKTGVNQEFLYIDYGLAVFDRKVIQEIPPGKKFDLAELYENLSLENRLLAHEISERFYEIGSVEGLKDFKNYIAQKE